MKLRRVLSIAMVVALLMTSFTFASAQAVTRKDYIGGRMIVLTGRIKVTMTNKTNGRAVLHLLAPVDFKSVGVSTSTKLEDFPEQTMVELALSATKNTNLKKKYHNKDVRVEGVLYSNESFGSYVAMTPCRLAAPDGSRSVMVTNLPKPKSIKIVGDSHQLAAGKTMQLSATVKPASALQMVGSWSSSNKKIATVESDGMVTGVKKGTCYITAKTSNGKTNKWKVKVLAGEPGVTLSDSAITLDVGATKTIKCTLYPAGTDGGLRVETDNASIASITGSGDTVVVKGEKPGKATVTVSTVGGQYEAKCEVTVLGTGPVENLTKIELKLEGNALMGVNATKQASVVLTPVNTKNPTLTWVSSNPAVATVDTNGLITGKVPGVTIIEARSKIKPAGATAPLIGTAMVFVTGNPSVGEKPMTTNDLKVTFKGATIDLKAGHAAFVAAVPGYTETDSSGKKVYTGSVQADGVSFAYWYENNGDFYYFNTGATDTAFKTARNVAGGSTPEQMLTAYGVPGNDTSAITLEHTYDAAGNVTEAKYKIYATYFIGTANYLRFRLDMTNQKIDVFVIG